MGVHHYYEARANGRTEVEAPPEIIEIGLMREFHWLPMEIDQIPLGRLQRIFLAMEQADKSQTEMQELAAKKAGDMKKQNVNPSGKQKRR